MSEIKHTPGPWSYATHSDGWHYTINIHQAEDATYTPDWSDVAFCTCKGERQEIQEANARLIAAAPELLEALKLWQAYDDSADTPDPDDVGMMLRYAEALTATRKAVNKATGAA